MRNGAALRGVLALGFDRDRVAAENVELALSKRLLVQLASLSGGCNGIKHTSVGDTRFGVVRNQLVAVGRHANSGIPRLTRHTHIPPPRNKTPKRCLTHASRS